MSAPWNILVVGGAGYVGSVTTAWLLDQGHRAWVLDDLSTGSRENLIGTGFTQAKAGDRDAVYALLSEQHFDGVLHFAARSLAGESVQKPKEYFENNVLQTRALLETMLEAGVHRMIFSSTCAIFGEPETDTLTEASRQKPINPYGETKLQVEHALSSLAEEEGLESVALRYFNAAGADSKLRVGERHDPETHLIPRVLQCAHQGWPVELFGTDYPTPDGTCVRDYVHVWDLAAAHGRALERLIRGEGRDPKATAADGRFEAFNLGSESGFSVRQVIAACEKVTGKRIQVHERPRRPGDPPKLVSDSSHARKVLGFKAEHSKLETMVQSAWDWELKKNQRT